MDIIFILFRVLGKTALDDSDNELEAEFDEKSLCFMTQSVRPPSSSRGVLAHVTQKKNYERSVDSTSQADSMRASFGHTLSEQQSLYEFMTQQESQGVGPTKNSQPEALVVTKACISDMYERPLYDIDQPSTHAKPSSRQQRRKGRSLYNEAQKLGIEFGLDTQPEIIRMGDTNPNTDWVVIAGSETTVGVMSSHDVANIVMPIPPGCPASSSRRIVSFAPVNDAQAYVSYLDDEEEERPMTGQVCPSLIPLPSLILLSLFLQSLLRSVENVSIRVIAQYQLREAAAEQSARAPRGCLRSNSVPGPTRASMHPKLLRSNCW